MTLAIDITYERGLNNEVHLLKKSKVMLYFHSKGPLTMQLYITNKMERFSFKSMHAVCIAKLIKTDWLVVCIAMCSLVLSCCSCDINTIHKYNSSLTCSKSPGFVWYNINLFHYLLELRIDRI